MSALPRAHSVAAPGHWSDAADRWLEQFCGPDADPLATRYNFPALMEIVPSPGGRTLEVGCGDGRVSRILEALGHEVVGVEPVSNSKRIAPSE